MGDGIIAIGNCAVEVVAIGGSAYGHIAIGTNEASGWFPILRGSGYTMEEVWALG